MAARGVRLYEWRWAFVFSGFWLHRIARSSIRLVLRRAEAFHDYAMADLERDIAAIREASRQ